MKVLVIEKDQRILRDISSCLQVRYPEVSVVSVAKGSEGIEMIEQEQSDLVMAASSLTNMDNVALIENIPSSPMRGKMRRRNEILVTYLCWDCGNIKTVYEESDIPIPAKEVWNLCPDCILHESSNSGDMHLPPLRKTPTHSRGEISWQ